MLTKLWRRLRQQDRVEELEAAVKELDDEPTLRAHLRDAWIAGAAHAMSSHKLFVQIHLDREDWLDARLGKEERAS